MCTESLESPARRRYRQAGFMLSNRRAQRGMKQCAELMVSMPPLTLLSFLPHQRTTLKPPPPTPHTQRHTQTNICCCMPNPAWCSSISLSKHNFYGDYSISGHGTSRLGRYGMGLKIRWPKGKCIDGTVGVFGWMDEGWMDE